MRRICRTPRWSPPSCSSCPWRSSARPAPGAVGWPNKEPPVVLFNLWGDPEAGSFSPEPWVGLQNSLNLQQGLVRLSPGRSWTWTVRIRPERLAQTAAAAWH